MQMDIYIEKTQYNQSSKNLKTKQMLASFKYGQ